MKYHLVKYELDIEKLATKISQKKDAQYLIMNKDTAEALYKQAKVDIIARTAALGIESDVILSMKS